MRMLLIAVAALLVLGGGAAGAYFYFMQSAEASAGSEVGENHDEHKKTKHAKDDHGDAHFEYVELDPLILPIVDNNGVSQTVSLVIALEVTDAKAKTEVEKYAPKLKDAYIEKMYGMLNRHAALKGGVIQISMIKKQLNKISTDVLGEDKVHGVLLQVVQQRPI